MLPKDWYITVLKHITVWSQVQGQSSIKIGHLGLRFWRLFVSENRPNNVVTPQGLLVLVLVVYQHNKDNQALWHHSIVWHHFETNKHWNLTRHRVPTAWCIVQQYSTCNINIDCKIYGDWADNVSMPIDFPIQNSLHIFRKTIFVDKWVCVGQNLRTRSDLKK